MTVDTKDEPSSNLLHSEAALLSVAGQAVDHARVIGAAAAAATASESAGTSIKVRNGSPSSSIREGGHSLSITVFDNGRSGHASSEAIDPASIKRAVEQAHAIALQVQPDPDAGLADPVWLATTGAEVQLFAPSGDTPGGLTNIARDLEAQALARASARGVQIRVDEAHAASADMRWACVNSNGFARASSASIQSRSCVAIAERDGEMVRNWWHSSDRRREHLAPLTIIAGEAVDRAAAGLGARSLPTQLAPVLLDARIAASLVQDLVSGLMGQAQHQKSTYLADSLGSTRLSEHLDLVEDPFEPFGLASSAWDRQGVRGSRRHIVEAGVIAGYFLDVRSARKLGLAPTGNANGPSNLLFSSRKVHETNDNAAMLRKMDRGFWVTEFLGGGVDPATGNYSKAASGFWVEKGQVLHPVRDVTIAGELPAMLRNIVGVGRDLYRQGAIRTGSILLETMRIAGR